MREGCVKGNALTILYPTVAYFTLIMEKRNCEWDQKYNLLMANYNVQSFYAGNSDDFEDEIKMTHANEKLMKFLDKRGAQAKKGKLIPMTEVEKRLGIKKRNGGSSAANK